MCASGSCEQLRTGQPRACIASPTSAVTTPETFPGVVIRFPSMSPHKAARDVAAVPPCPLHWSLTIEKPRTSPGDLLLGIFLAAGLVSGAVVEALTDSAGWFLALGAAGIAGGALSSWAWDRKHGHRSQCDKRGEKDTSGRGE